MPAGPHHPYRSTRPASPSPTAPSTPHRLESHQGLIGLASNLAHDFDQVHAVALTDPDGVVVDGTLLNDPAHSIDHAVGFALCLALGLEATNLTATFFSVVPAPATTSASACSERWAKSWKSMNEVLSAVVHVRDWLITDGSAVHSMAERR